MPSGSTRPAADDEPTFGDTNVLVYAYDATDRPRQLAASEALLALWERRTGILSSQVLQEFYVVATAAHKLAMTPSEAREIVDLYSAWPVVVVEPTLILTASRLHERRSISFWDALIVEAARVGRPTRILTEDLRAGEVIDGIAIVDPFGA